ncbi:hypothetical protein Z517_12408 [Fonsecaea pedrosoi CBS 271.37]|uniref:Protein HRI1 n=1 Tax=Fonsecaea pedrosoi CBS 271.37 TaxID=1442368 RepID=A0A0D2G138_9EURO|nr:uncharacterized protein Z517_12408 [Fonsecaea pedrosoi CBS 271.37]KIW74468.1 hypothetical protein Z517_12408 [Fonsecaea pedrosoi CBS 271.37]
MVIKSTPQILKRVSIRWLPDDAFEDTDTIALNVDGYYMDLRVTLTDKTLQWSRAGERKTLARDGLTFRWTRIIDSKGSRQSDEASFVDLSNGDSLETGKFDKEGNGTLTDYEEVWRDVTKDTESDEEGSAWILQSTDESMFLGRIGHMFLGMQESAQGCFAVRKEVWSSKSGTGSWHTVFEAGPVQSIPRAGDVQRDLEIGGRGGMAEKKGQTVVICDCECIVRGTS